MKKLYLCSQLSKKIYVYIYLFLISVLIGGFFETNVFGEKRALINYSIIKVKPTFIKIYPKLLSPNQKLLAFHTFTSSSEEKHKILDDIWFLNIMSGKILAFSPNSMLQKFLYPYIEARDASWSPDSKKIVFSFHTSFYNDKRKQKICTFDLATGKVKYLNPKEKFEYEKLPTWSPTGKEIAFFGKERFKRPQLFLYNLETATLRQLTDKAVDAIPLAWSSDGLCLLFGRDKSLWKKEISTGHEIRLTNKYSNIRHIQIYGKNIFFVSIEPSGNQLIKKVKKWQKKRKKAQAEGKNFIESRPICTYEIWKTDLSGITPELIGLFKTMKFTPVVSSSGSTIVVALPDAQVSNYHIWKYNIATRSLQQLTFGKTNDASPIWLSGEKYIIFNRNTNTIWIMNSDGSNQHQIFPKP